MKGHVSHWKLLGISLWLLLPKLSSRCFDSNDCHHMISHWLTQVPKLCLQINCTSAVVPNIVQTNQNNSAESLSISSRIFLSSSNGHCKTCSSSLPPSVATRPRLYAKSSDLFAFASGNEEIAHLRRSNKIDPNIMHSYWLITVHLCIYAA